MASDQQCSPIVRYWRKFFYRAEMEIKSEGVTRSARFWGSNWRMGFIILANRRTGFKCSDRGSFAKKKISGFEKSIKKERNNNPEWMSGVQAMVIPALPFILVSRSTLLFR